MKLRPQFYWNIENQESFTNSSELEHITEPQSIPEQKSSLMKLGFPEQAQMKSFISYYAAATLELSHPENEERKARALAATTAELEWRFDKKDFGRMKPAAEAGHQIVVLNQSLLLESMLMLH
ncbi:hypothetical protein CDL15_Pgr010253 [Punica granatum]|uniref:Uncharacterized protein n=1 Tax=Punica granatum TaxID=22663 RepID=A0A218XRR8_PUNGR|nr:hypothetical protein CDL15_Pgr010253 [Punica granatum]